MRRKSGLRTAFFYDFSTYPANFHAFGVYNYSTEAFKPL